jgi:hypothetical protein
VNPRATQQTDRRHNNTTVQPPQDDTAHVTQASHTPNQHSASTPTLNPLLTPHIQLEYSVKHRSIRHHRAEHYALRHVRHPRRSRGRIVRLLSHGSLPIPRCPHPQFHNEPHKPHKTIATVPVAYLSITPSLKVLSIYTQAHLPILAVLLLRTQVSSNPSMLRRRVSE